MPPSQPDHTASFRRLSCRALPHSVLQKHSVTTGVRHMSEAHLRGHKAAQPCFHSEHRFSIRSRAVVGSGAEGRPHGSSALTDLSLFEVPAVGALMMFSPLSRSALPTLPGAVGMCWGQLWSRRTGEGHRWSCTANSFSRGYDFSFGVCQLAQAHLHAESRTSVHQGGHVMPCVVMGVTAFESL